MAKKSAEAIKAESQGLRGTIAAELETSSRFFSADADKLLKFHGTYQQEDRDARKDKTTDHHSFMVRTKLPGGQLTAAQYLVHDDIATELANGTLRITTRQDFQFHGILKDSLQDTMRRLNHSLVTTFGACGDVVRNVMACPAPTADPQRRAVQEMANALSDAMFPRTRAYHQIWLDGQQLIDETPPDEPLYGQTYLPRKFKIAIAYAGDNCVDVYTNDVGLVALFDDANTLIGFNLLAGGGMGMTHQNDATYARLADEVGFITADQVVPVVQAIVTIHRDFGDRENRKHARLKYVLHERGVAWFREELSARIGFAVPLPRPMPAFKVEDHLGWNEAGDGTWYLGIPVENGRIVDRGTYRLRSGLRAVIERFDLPIRLSAQQNLLLTAIAPDARAGVEAMLGDYGILTVEQISRVRRGALACPALPTCSLAITEAERIFPAVIDEMETALTEIGLGDADIIVRMTGCPNGCARPYVAEIAYVGRSLDKYAVYIGGAANGTRLARPFLDLVPRAALISTLRPVLAHYRDAREMGETFGDFVGRAGLESLRALVSQGEPAIGD